MKVFFAATATAALVSAVSADTCGTSTLLPLLSDEYIDQCAADSKYSFTSGVQPTATEAAAMCTSEACQNLLADVQGMGLSECTLPIGDEIELFADLIDYVADGCAASTPEPTTATPEPTTATPEPMMAVPLCGTAQLKTLLTSSYTSQCASDANYKFTAATYPTADQVVEMCNSESCVALFDQVASEVTTDCQIPVGDHIMLLTDLVDYVSDQCQVTTPEPTTATPEPSTATPETPEPSTETPVASCSTAVLSALLTNEYIDQCASDSGYSFISGTQPDADEVAGMCASEACANLLVDVEALGLSECIVPIGDNIFLFADLVDYVADQCKASTGSPTTETPTTEPPVTDLPIGTVTPEPTTPPHDSC